MGNVGIDIGPVPPTTAQRLEQGDAVGEAGRLSADQGKPRALVGLLGRQYIEIGAATGLILRTRHREACSGSFLRLQIGGQRFGVALHGYQRVGHILKGAVDRAAVLRGGHISSRYSNPNQQNIGMPPPDEQTLPNGDIVVPNGNGTSTVISPTGKVTTTQTPK